MSGNYINSKNSKPCLICGKLTKKINIHSEQRICSVKCQDEEDKRYDKYLKSINRFLDWEM